MMTRWLLIFLILIACCNVRKTSHTLWLQSNTLKSTRIKWPPFEWLISFQPCWWTSEKTSLTSNQKWCFHTITFWNSCKLTKNSLMMKKLQKFWFCKDDSDFHFSSCKNQKFSSRLSSSKTQSKQMPMILLSICSRSMRNRFSSITRKLWSPMSKVINLTTSFWNLSCTCLKWCCLFSLLTLPKFSLKS